MRSFFFIILFFVSGTSSVLAVSGRILGDMEAEQADTAALNAEAGLLKSIGMGIALSLAQCEGQENCKPAVDQTELKQLLDTINVRIDDLVLRQQKGGEDYTDLLTAYVDQREKYTDYQKKLEDIGITAEDNNLEEDTSINEAIAPEEETQKKGKVDLSIFEDADKALLEDSGLEEDLPQDEGDSNSEDLNNN